MYFILSKVLFIFIKPLFWIFCLLLYAAITRKKQLKQKLLICGCALLYIFSAKVCADLFARMWDVPRYHQDGKKYSAVILLGGFVSQVSEGNGHFNESADRFTQAVKLLKQGKAQKLLFTGGNASLHPDKFTEAGYVAVELKRMGIPGSLVLLDSKARNTFENASYTKAILKQANLKPPYLLVTSSFHMRRARLIFKKANIPVVCYPADFQITDDLILPDYLPSVEAVGEWQLYIKEVVGYIVTLFK